MIQPPPFNSAWQFEHHGAQRCTTLRYCDLIASAILCSAGEGSALSSEVVVKRAVKIDNPEIIRGREYGRRRKLAILLSAYGRNAARSRDAVGTLCRAVEIGRLDKLSPQWREFDLRAENAYYGVPFPLLNYSGKIDAR